MRYITLLFIILSIYGSQCPNLCSGHGTCNSNGMCNCYPQWMEGDCSQRTCPYGVGVADPNGHESKHDLECSGQGICDRSTGSCQCFNGFGGSSCERVLCPNDCNGHGVCTQANYLSIDTDTYYYDQYINSDRIAKGNDFSEKWDGNVIYTCLCDPEYTGFDCAQKKCKLGYQQTSYCDSPSQYVQEILIVGKTVTGGKNLISGCLAYANYTDSFGRSWITRPFNIFKETNKPTGDKITYDNKCDDKSKFPSFKEALESLPAGVIDIESIDFKPFKTGDSALSLQIKYGNQQTGKQNAIQIIQNSDFNKGDGFDDSNLPHGIVELKDNYPLDATILYQETTYIPPVECANNGYCNRQSGVCECFDGFWGDACTEIVPVM